MENHAQSIVIERNASESCLTLRGPLVVLYDIVGTEAIGILCKKGLTFPVRAFFSKKVTVLRIVSKISVFDHLIPPCKSFFTIVIV